MAKVKKRILRVDKQICNEKNTVQVQKWIENSYPYSVPLKTITEAVTTENVHKVMNNRKLKVREIAQIVKISTESALSKSWA